MVEGGVDHGGGIAWGHATNPRMQKPGPADVKKVVADRLAIDVVVRVFAGPLPAVKFQAVKLGVQDPLTAHHVIRVENRGRVAVRRVGLVVKREVVLAQDVVGAAGATAAHAVEHEQGMFRCVSLKRCLILAAGVQRVLEAAVGSGVEMAAGTRLAAIAGVHLPEEGLAEDHGHVGIDDERLNTGNLRQVLGRQGSQVTHFDGGSGFRGDGVPRPVRQAVTASVLTSVQDERKQDTGEAAQRRFQGNHQWAALPRRP